MHNLDDAHLEAIARLLAEAPPLPADLVALAVRTFTSTAPDTSSPVSDAA